jgi:predicted DNA-binding helix-hairpin-helix protein
LQTKPPESKWREHRLYQGSFLIQRYGFLARDFVLDDAGMLPLDRDPKVLMARRLELCVNLEDADFEDLIKVPGIGLKAAKNLIELRRSSKLSVGQLKRAGVIIKRALPFLDPGRFGQLSLSHFA